MGFKRPSPLIQAGYNASGGDGARPRVLEQSSERVELSSSEELSNAPKFNAKIRNLNDYYLRTSNNIPPLPSGIDIANTLKHFSQTLLGVLKDVPSIPAEILLSQEKDSVRLSMFPNLNYSGLYHAIVNIIDIVPQLQYGQYTLGQAILHTLACLLPFLEHELLDSLPYIVASTMAVLPSSLHKEIIDLLCNNLLPFTIGATTSSGGPSYATLSTSAIIMMVFQYTDNGAFHTQLLECLMALKKDTCKDLLCVIAYGSPTARSPAANLLFHYWPSLNPALQDRRGIHYKYTAWKPLICQRENCLSPVNNEAVKMCIDPSLAVRCSERPPPLYVCQDCADLIRRENSEEYLMDVLLPIDHVSQVCENKNCTSVDKSAYSTCFSFECVSYNHNRPIRYCMECDKIRHNYQNRTEHIYHTTLPSPWSGDVEMQGYMIESIISLLKEVQPLESKRNIEMGMERQRWSAYDNDSDDGEEVTVDERRLLSRYGIWLLVGLCSPNEDTPVETLGRLLGMLFQWFDATAYLPDDGSGDCLERLKPEYIFNWLMSVSKSHFDVFVSCLLPHPVEYARVGGHWDTLTNRTTQIKEGLYGLFCLIPYDIITYEVWDYVMPFWMEAIRTEIPDEELCELQILLRKTFDTDMSPLPFPAEKVYHFMTVKFQSAPTPVQQQALRWLQILTSLDIIVPLHLLLSMFNHGVFATINPTEKPEESHKIAHAGSYAEYQRLFCGIDDIHLVSPLTPDYSPISPERDFASNEEINLLCFILMLDILLKQMELCEIPLHQGMDNNLSKDIMSLLTQMLTAAWVGQHECKLEEGSIIDCQFCQSCSIWYQLAFLLVEYISPLVEVVMPEDPTLKMELTTARDESKDQKHIISKDKEEQKKEDSKHPQSAVISMKELEQKTTETDPVAPRIILSTAVEVVSDVETEMVAIMPTEQVVTAIARAVTLTETDVGLATCTVAQATLVDENECPVLKEVADDGTFWHTSQGKFKFSIEELPSQLQLIYVLLKDLPKQQDPDVLYNLLKCLKLLCLHAECLSKAAREHRGFLIWCQENLLINNLWKLLNSEHSQMAQIAVPLILHCITLPCGSDVFWKLVEDDFLNDEWKCRNDAVEKVTVLARFLDSEPVKTSPTLASSLANAFCYLIATMDDINAAVAQRAALFLETIKKSAILCLCSCLETQFDSVIDDRPMILHRLYQLYHTLPEVSILNWDFFLNRFDTLSLEAQVDLENSGEIAYPTDLRNSAKDSDTFLRKLNRARFALSRSENIRSLTASLAGKNPYKRAFSAPGGMIARKDPKIDKEKVYNRQASAPILQRKRSKMGMGMFANHLFPGGQLKEFTDEESNFTAMLHRAMDLEGVDRDTVHLLVTLLMRFMSNPVHSTPSEDKFQAKSQSIVLRHLNVLLGYSQTEKSFSVPPYKLRYSTVCNAFLSGLPKVLDHNFKLGTTLLPTTLNLLKYCPSPQRYASDYQPPNYTLWFLEPHTRHSWLMSLIVIVYKYRYGNPPLCKSIQTLIRIVINTLDAQYHHCKKHSDEFSIGSPILPRSRDVSSVSIGDLENIQETETPPVSPFRMQIGEVAGESVRIAITSPAEGTVHFQAKGRSSVVEEPPKQRERPVRKPHKLPDYSYDENVEQEDQTLEAIPEGPKQYQEKEEKESGKPDKDDEFSELVILDEPVLEKARVRVERPFADTQLEELSTATEVQTSVMVASASVVDSHMAQELKAFRESFTEKSRKKDEVVSAGLVTLDSQIVQPTSIRVAHDWIDMGAFVIMESSQMLQSSGEKLSDSHIEKATDESMEKVKVTNTKVTVATEPKKVFQAKPVNGGQLLQSRFVQPIFRSSSLDSAHPSSRHMEVSGNILQIAGSVTIMEPPTVHEIKPSSTHAEPASTVRIMEPSANIRVIEPSGVIRVIEPGRNNLHESSSAIKILDSSCNNRITESYKQVNVMEPSGNIQVKENITMKKITESLRDKHIELSSKSNGKMQYVQTNVSDQNLFTAKFNENNLAVHQLTTSKSLDINTTESGNSCFIKTREIIRASSLDAAHPRQVIPTTNLGRDYVSSEYEEKAHIVEPVNFKEHIRISEPVKVIVDNRESSFTPPSNVQILEPLPMGTVVQVAESVHSDHISKDVKDSISLETRVQGIPLGKSKEIVQVTDLFGMKGFPAKMVEVNMVAPTVGGSAQEVCVISEDRSSTLFEPLKMKNISMGGSFEKQNVFSFIDNKEAMKAWASVDTINFPKQEERRTKIQKLGKLEKMPTVEGTGNEILTLQALKTSNDQHNIGYMHSNIIQQQMKWLEPLQVHQFKSQYQVIDSSYEHSIQSADDWSKHTQVKPSHMIVDHWPDQEHKENIQSIEHIMSPARVSRIEPTIQILQPAVMPRQARIDSSSLFVDYEQIPSYDHRTEIQAIQLESKLIEPLEPIRIETKIKKIEPSKMIPQVTISKSSQIAKTEQHDQKLEPPQPTFVKPQVQVMSTFPSVQVEQKRVEVGQLIQMEPKSISVEPLELIKVEKRPQVAQIMEPIKMEQLQCHVQKVKPTLVEAHHMEVINVATQAEKPKVQIQVPLVSIKDTTDLLDKKVLESPKRMLVRQDSLHQKDIFNEPMSPKLTKQASIALHDSDLNMSMDEEDEDDHTVVKQYSADSEDGDVDDDHLDMTGHVFEHQKPKPQFRQRKTRKTGLTTVELRQTIPELQDGFTDEIIAPKKSRKAEMLARTAHSKRPLMSSSSLRCGEDTVVNVCMECGALLEQYDEETLGLCIVILGTFTHREPALAAPLLLDMLKVAVRIASTNPYPWQAESNIIVPGSASNVAKQFLRCTLHQLAPSGIFLRLFQSTIEDLEFFKTIALALTDFNELNSLAPLLSLLESLNEHKTLPSENIMLLLTNMATYMEHLPLESSSPAWNNILTQFEVFFRKLPLVLPNPADMTPTIKIMSAILRIPGLAGIKVSNNILDPFAELLSFTIQNCTFKLQHLLELCSLCNRAFVRERDRLFLSRVVTMELVQVLKFKTSMPDENLMKLVQFVVEDAGGAICPSSLVEEVTNNFDIHNMINTNASECMRQNLSDCLEFISDVHTINKIRNNIKTGSPNLNEDTLGGQIKAGLSQYVALEFTKGNNRDNRAISRHLPWLYHPPSAMQQGPREFIDCVAHIRLLSWLLLGSLMHSAVFGTCGTLVCQPVPLEASTHISDHIIVVLTGFAEQSKVGRAESPLTKSADATIVHMSSLFHAFILCQLWTMYCEQLASINPPFSETHQTAATTIMDFWARVTPGILQLLSHSKVEGRVELAEMVNLHFLTLMEALQECNSTVLAKLFAMWSPVLHSYHSQLPSHMQVRLQACHNWIPPTHTKDEAASLTSVLLKWLQRLQFKMAQIEVQSSAATQFYSV